MITAAWEHQESRHFEEDIRERQQAVVTLGRLGTPSQASSLPLTCSPATGLASCVLPLYSQPVASLTPQDTGEAQTGHLHPGSMCPLALWPPQVSRPSPAHPSPHLSPPGCSRHLLAGLHLTGKNVPWSHAPFELLSAFPVPLPLPAQLPQPPAPFPPLQGDCSHQ